MKELSIQPDTTVRQAMKTLSQLGEKCLVIINEKNQVLGTLSDGDLRRDILKGAVMGDSIKNIYQQNPTLLVEGKYLLDEAKKLFTTKKFLRLLIPGWSSGYSLICMILQVNLIG